jgi:hypothetical protein
MGTLIHCVQGTPGAEFAPGLQSNRVEAIFRKATDPAIDSYSGSFDNSRRKVDRFRRLPVRTRRNRGPSGRRPIPGRAAPQPGR